MKKKIIKGLKRILASLGYKISRINTESNQVVDKFSMFSALRRCKERELKIDIVIDVGASNGKWSRECLNYFPSSKYLLVEAQEGHLEALNQFKNEHENVDFSLAAAGKEDGEIYFNNAGLFGGIASETKFESNCVELPMISLDKEVERKKLFGSYLLKLDTHGFEIPILEGAKELIKSAELIIIETYNYKLTNDSLLYYEMCDYMYKIGFRPLEMVDLMLREYDNTFWQMDTFFVPKTNENFNYNSYQ